MQGDINNPLGLYDFHIYECVCLCAFYGIKKYAYRLGKVYKWSIYEFIVNLQSEMFVCIKIRLVRLVHVSNMMQMEVLRSPRFLNKTITNETGSYLLLLLY